MMRVCLLLAAAALCLFPSSGAAAEAIARVRSEASYKVKIYHEWTEKEGVWGFRKTVVRSRTDTQQESYQGSGSGFVLETSAGPTLVTAAHVLHLQNRPTRAAGRDLDGNRAWVSQRRLTCVVGPLAFSPSEVGVVTLTPSKGPPFTLDIALLRFSDDAALEPYQRYRLANRLPRVGERVTAIGLPSTQFPQPTETTVTFVQEDANFFVLSSELPPGYSGGVVLDERGRVLGVVTGQSDKQSTVLRLNSSLVRAAQFQPFSALSDWHAFRVPAK